MSNKCPICQSNLKIETNPLTGIPNVLYCENCDVYLITDNINDTPFTHCFIKIPQLLTEASVPGAPERANLKLSIDTREQRHKNIPHFHIYYGESHRSVGYKIEDLSPLGEELDSELSRMDRDVGKFLNDIQKWMFKPNKKCPSKTNKQFMLDMYNQIVGTLT